MKEYSMAHQNLMNESQGDEVSLLDVLELIAENARLLVLGPIVAGLTALAITFIIPPTYTATARILPPQQQQSAATILASELGTLAGLVGPNTKNAAEIYVALMKSRSVADRLTDRFNLIELYGHKYRDDTRTVLQGATKVSAGKDGLITIQFEDKDAKRAADITNGYVQELVRLTGSLAITEAQQRRAFFEKQLQQAQEGLKKAELALGQSGVGEALIKSTPQAVVEAVARLKAQVTAQEIRVSTMRGYLTESSPEFQIAQRELSALRAQLFQAERSQPVGEMPASDYLNRFRDFKYQETLFELMAKQYEVARLDEAREGAAIQVVDQAIVPERKSGPKRLQIAVLTTIGALIVLLLYVLICNGIRAVAADPQSANRLARIRSLLRPW